MIIDSFVRHRKVGPDRFLIEKRTYDKFTFLIVNSKHCRSRLPGPEHISVPVQSPNRLKSMSKISEVLFHTE